MSDTVNHPAHYKGSNGIEAWDVIEGFGLNYNVGVAVAYLLRAERKGDPVENFRKAVAHLGREIEQRGRAAPHWVHVGGEHISGDVDLAVELADQLKAALAQSAARERKPARKRKRGTR